MDIQTTKVIKFALDNLKSEGVGNWKKGTSMRVALEWHYNQHSEWREIQRDIMRSFGVAIPKIFYIHVCIYMEEANRKKERGEAHE